MSIAITDDDHFNQVFEEKKSKPVILFFTATWCGPCQMIKPYIEERATELNDRLTVLKIDVDEVEATVEKYGVNSMPTFLLIVNGETKFQFSGYSVDKSKEIFEKALE